MVVDFQNHEIFGKISERLEGWGTCLKPAYEPIIVARKPFDGSLINNILENGVGGLNIEECRIPTNDNLKGGAYSGNTEFIQQSVYNKIKKLKPEDFKQPSGRFPSNVILTYNEEDKEEVCGGMPDNNGSVSRYFYCAKASKCDKNDGLDTENLHPTVKPVSLMQYLVRLVSPKGATILDPFMGSGSTGKAIMCENKERQIEYKFIGIELNEKYMDIAKNRIDYILKEDK